MNVDLSPVLKAFEPIWRQIKLLFAEHHFLTILCGFFAVMMTISCYRFLKSISPALVGLILLVVLFVLILHWTQTRSEPPLLKPFIDFLAPWFPTLPTHVPMPKK